MTLADLFLDRTEKARTVWRIAVAALLVAYVVFPSAPDSAPILRGLWATWACWYIARNHRDA